MDQDRSEWQKALEDVRARVERLEAVQAPAGAGRDQRFWALEALRAGDEPGGSVVFAGVVRLPDGRRVEWQKEHPARNVVLADWAELAPALAALGHPVRLVLLQSMLEGAHSVKELGDIPGLGTTGQLYHHLRELQAAGWVRLERRNHYAIPAERVVPLLVAIACATP
jgi:hypothetical protein